MPWVFVRRALVVVLLAGGCALCFGRLVVHPLDTLVGPQRGGANDLTDYVDPLFDYKVRAWREFGRPPSWDPYLQLGRPLVGNPQSALYYPPNWLPLLLGFSSPGSWLLVAHHLFAGWGMYLLCRQYRFAWPAALLGGVAFLAAPVLVAHTAEGHYPQTSTVAWIPWALLAYERFRRGRRAAVPCLALVLALAFFCGHVQEVYYLVVILTGLLAADLVRHGASRLARWRKLAWPPPEGILPPGGLALRWLAVGALTFGLVAVDFFPIWITALQTTRAHSLDMDKTAALGGANLENLWQLADPLALGGPDSFGPRTSFYWESQLSLGVIPLALALLAAALAPRSQPVGRYGVLLVLAVLFSLGDATPLFPFLQRVLPGISTFRVPTRAMFFAAAAVSVLAAGGLHHLLRRWGEGEDAAATESGRRGDGDFGLARRRWMIGLSVAAAVMLVLLAVALRLPAAPAAYDNIGWATLNKAYAPGWLAAALAALVVVLCSRSRATYAGLLPVALVAVELSTHAWTVTRTVSPAGTRTSSEIAELLRDSAGDYRVLADQSLLSDAEARRHRIAKVRGYDPFLLTHYADILDSAAGRRELLPGEGPGYTTERRLNYAQPPLRMLGVRYILVPHRDEVRAPAWRLVQTGTIQERITPRGAQPRTVPYSLYENTAALPRAYVLGHSAAMLGGPFIKGQLLENDPAKQVIVQHDRLPAGERQDFAAAEVVEYGPSRVVVDAQLDAPGYLVLSDLHFFTLFGRNFGWTATAGGEPASIERVNVGLRGVPLQPGRHHVVFSFSPPLWSASAAATLLSLALCAYLAVKSKDK